MTWYFNFCAPTLPNDPVINLHRHFQTACLMTLMIFYIIVHIYYKICQPHPVLQKRTQQNKQSNEDRSSQNQKASQQNSVNRQQHEKSVSIVGGDENSSYVTFTVGKLNSRKKDQKDEKDQNQKIKQQYQQHVTIKQIQQYFPIVFGHFAIACAFTISYSPYAQQSIAIIIYIILSLILHLVNCKRMLKLTRCIWIFMCLLICFLIISGLLELGQANFNKIRQQCFSVNYQSLY